MGCLGSNASIRVLFNRIISDNSKNIRMELCMKIMSLKTFFFLVYFFTIICIQIKVNIYITCYPVCQMVLAVITIVICISETRQKLYRRMNKSRYLRALRDKERGEYFYSTTSSSTKQFCFISIMQFIILILSSV